MAESDAFARRTFLGGATVARIPGGLNAGVTGIVAADDLADWVGATADGPTRVMINRSGVGASGTTPEEVEISLVSGNNITIAARGLEGTSDTTHPANSTIELIGSPRDLDEANYWVAELAAATPAANRLIVGDGVNSLAGLDVPASRIILRKATGDIVAGTVAELKTLLALSTADLSDFDLTGIAAGAVLYWNGSDLIDLGIGTAGQVLTVNAGATAPEWAAASGGSSSPANVWIPAAAMGPQTGSPSLASQASNYATAWLLDQTSNESIATNLVVPSGWSTADIDLWWSAEVNTGGNVVWQIFTDNDADGAAIGGSGGSSSTVAAPAQSVLKKSTLATGATVTAGNLLNVLIFRTANSGSDTLAGDASVLGINLRKAS